ncbi:ATP-binding response regulator [Spirochaeta dissipatitropha]
MSGSYILLVDDDPLSLLQMKRALSGCAYIISADLDGYSAFNRIKNGDIPDLILMDIDLGTESWDGPETTRRIHELCEIPVVLHTAYADPQTFASAREMTKYGYVYKTPGNIEFVIASIETALKLFGTEVRLREREQQYRELSNYLQEIREEQNAFVAGELHDDLGQSLTALRMNLSLIEGSGKEELCSIISDMEHIIDQAVDRMRILINELRPPVLDMGSLDDLLRWQAREFEKNFRLPITLVIPDSGCAHELCVSKQERLCVFRIMQEALTNAVRHSGAKSFKLGLKYEQYGIEMYVQDDGAGFDTRAVCTKSRQKFGILGMHQRAAAIGGELSIESVPASGTLVRLVLPISKY